MIQGKIKADITTIRTHDGPAITYIHYEYLFFNEESNYCTRTTLVQHVLPSLSKCLDCIEEVSFCFLVTVNNGLFWILRKDLVFNYELMQVVSEEVSTSVTSMTIENTKEAAFGPVYNIFFGGWLHDIQNYTDSILVVISNDSLISVSCISHNVTIFAYTTFRWLPARQIQNCRIRRSTSSKQQLFNIQWLIGCLRWLWIGLVGMIRNSLRSRPTSICLMIVCITCVWTV